MLKIGLGEDSHRFSKENKKLILGGVHIPKAPGFKGNSDCDVILHAICNAFDVVSNKGSIATYSDPMCLEQKIDDSAKYLEHIQGIAQKKGWKAKSASISLEAKKPKLEPYSKKIKGNLAKLLKIKPLDIGLTFTSGEGLTDFGKGRGIRATAIITFNKI